MKYMGMPWGMWTLFAGSFQAQLTDVLGYNEQTAKAITRRAKAKYKEILSRLPEFEKGTASKSISWAAPCWGPSFSPCRSVPMWIG